MMRYLQRQKKSVISNTGFKRWRCLFAAMLLVLPAVFSLVMVGDALPVYSRMPSVGVQNMEEAPEQKLSKPSVGESEQQYTVREHFGIGSSQMLQQRLSFRYRYLQQIRLLVWYIFTGFLMLPGLLFAYYGDGKRQQKELIPRSLQIVRYRNRSDGKKEGIAFSIK